MKRVRAVVTAVVCTAVVAGGVAVAGPRPADLVDGSAVVSSDGVFARVTDGATVTDGAAVLDNGLVARRWLIGADGTVTTVGLSGAGRTDWAQPGPDFTLTIDGVPTSSVTGWQLVDVAAVPAPGRRGSNDPAAGAALEFHYALGTAQAPAIELTRLVVLHPGTTVFDTTSTLSSNGPAARVSAYSLDQVVTDPTLPATVDAYNGGSDWRDDYRHVSSPEGAFDVEGEVLRLGADSGVFLVSQRRGGVMSRAGRDAGGRSWVGVDWGRDLFDFGPLRTDPPDYNRQDNPAYPVPIRSRTLPALGTLDLGTSYLGVYSGGPQEAAAAFAREFVGNVMPAYPRTVGLNTFHPWGHGDGLSDPNLRRQVDLAAAMGVETFMLDDQWQGGAGGESGDWNWDADRFPDGDGDGRPDFVDYLHAKGLQLGLWMSPLEFNTASTTYAAHPDWACAPVGDLTAQVPDDAGLGVWDATNTAFQDYLLGVVDRLIATNQVTEFKFDFMAWVDCASDSPPGLHDYADYEAAFVDLVHRMQQAHPGVTFELDETNDQRAWPFESAEIGPSWFDNGHLHGSTRVAKLLHDVWSATPWLPSWSVGIGALDGTLTGPYDGVAGVDALMPLALLTHLTFWTDLDSLSAAQREAAARWTGWFRTHRDEFGPVTYELTDDDPLDGTSWAAWEPWNGKTGFVFAFRQGGGPRTAHLALHGLDPTTRYRVVNVMDKTVIAVGTGAQLEHDLAVTLPEYSAAVLSVSPLHQT